ncbi:syntaxin-17 [Nematostella vectensis]|uniref:syntaxin-17 n=1 Tax=Nematostella vectensis TaxID=45351 RepID=UPI0020770B80|nr:syntaxin-17 [Nematostella vectensis]
MASFEEYSLKGSRDGNTAYSLPKHPFKRFQATLDKFIKVALPTDIERLCRHQVNMEKFYKSELWRELTAEQINAARTVQQVKANISQMENTRKQVLDSEVHLFDEKVAPIKEEAMATVRSFRKVQRLYSQQGALQKGQLGREVKGETPQLHPDHQQLQQLQQHVIDESAVASWDALRDSLKELNELIHDFASIVHDQQSSLDTITDNIEQAHSNVQVATVELGKASKLKAAMYPVMGAVVGGVAGGPVGLVMGMKVGAAVAFGGGVLGYFSGQYIKKHRQEATEIELKKLSSSHQNQIVKKGL